MLTLREAVRLGRLDDFIAQESDEEALHEKRISRPKADYERNAAKRKRQSLELKDNDQK